MNRRSFFQLVTGTIASVYAACVPKTKRDMQATEIKEFDNQAERHMRKLSSEMYGKSLATSALKDIKRLDRLRASIIKTQEELIRRRCMIKWDQTRRIVNIKA